MKIERSARDDRGPRRRRPYRFRFFADFFADFFLDDFFLDDFFAVFFAALFLVVFRVFLPVFFFAAFLAGFLADFAVVFGLVRFFAGFRFFVALRAGFLFAAMVTPSVEMDSSLRDGTAYKRRTNMRTPS